MTIAETNLVEIAQAIAAHAAKLPWLGLEEACIHGSESALQQLTIAPATESMFRVNIGQ